MEHMVVKEDIPQLPSLKKGVKIHENVQHQKRRHRSGTGIPCCYWLYHYWFSE